jgi:hypothetical protein
MAGTIDKARMADGEEGVATDGFIRRSGSLWLLAAGALLLTSRFSFHTESSSAYLSSGERLILAALIAIPASNPTEEQ